MIKLLDILKEAFDNNNTIAYHRSDVDFDKFDINKTESGFGMNRLGWGLYFSENENLNPKYGNILYKVKFNIPTGKKWLEDYITAEETINLLDKLNLNGETEINNIFDGFEKQRGKKLTDPVIRYLVTNHFDKSSYGDFGKDFAIFLLKNGYIGRKVEHCENGQDICYIVFDPSIIEIISKG